MGGSLFLFFRLITKREGGERRNWMILSRIIMCKAPLPFIKCATAGSIHKTGGWIINNKKTGVSCAWKESPAPDVSSDPFPLFF